MSPGRTITDPGGGHTGFIISASLPGVTVSPAAGVWTEFEVRDVDGRVQIAARKGDLTISDNTGTTTLAQGEQTTRDDSQSQKEEKKKNRRVAAAAIPAWGGALDSPWAVGIGAGLIGTGVVWVLVKSDDPVSPAIP